MGLAPLACAVGTVGLLPRLEVWGGNVGDCGDARAGELGWFGGGAGSARSGGGPAGATKPDDSGPPSCVRGNRGDSGGGVLVPVPITVTEPE